LILSLPSGKAHVNDLQALQLFLASGDGIAATEQIANNASVPVDYSAEISNSELQR
jgi:hypothetical protein